MGYLLAAAPFEDFARENAPFLAVLICALLALLVFRLVVRTVTRLLLLGILFLSALFVVAERDEITRCAETCKCSPGGLDMSIAFCDPHRPPFST